MRRWIRVRQARRCFSCTYYRLGSTAAVLLTKPPRTRAGNFSFLRNLQAKKRADERTRTADLEPH